MHHRKYDPSMERLKPGTKVGVVGENAIWDGPLDQVGRAHKPGSSSGADPIEVLKASCECGAGMPITKRAKLG